MFTAACSDSSRSLMGPGASASLDKNGGAGGGGNAHWVTDYTGFDVTTNTAYFQAAGFGKNSDPFTITLTGRLTVTYDCENDTPSGHVHIVRAFTDVQETFTRTATFRADRNGQASGLLVLDFSNVGALRCPPSQNSPTDVLGPWRATNIQTSLVNGVTVTASKYLPTLTLY